MIINTHKSGSLPPLTASRQQINASVKRPLMSTKKTVKPPLSGGPTSLRAVRQHH